MPENDATQAASNRRVQVNMIVNGSARTLTVEPRMTLLDALRDELGLTGPKKSCDRGECGACTADVEIRERLSGNLCRCACYPNIVDAVAHAARRS